MMDDKKDLRHMILWYGYGRVANAGWFPCVAFFDFDSRELQDDLVRSFDKSDTDEEVIAYVLYSPHQHGRELVSQVIYRNVWKGLHLQVVEAQ